MFSPNDIVIKKLNTDIYYNNHDSLHAALCELDDSYTKLSFSDQMQIMLKLWIKLNHQIDLYSSVDDVSHNQRTFIYTFMYYDDVFTCDIYDSQFMDSIYAITGNDLFINNIMTDAYDIVGLKSHLIDSGYILRYDQLMMIHNNDIKLV